jgi:hypothetical protein
MPNHAARRSAGDLFLAQEIVLDTAGYVMHGRWHMRGLAGSL